MVLSEDDIERINRALCVDMRSKRVKIYDRCSIPSPNSRILHKHPKIISIVNSGRITIDELAAEGCANKVQNDWIEYFNQRREIMISTGDLYQWLKQGNLDQKILASLRDDFSKIYLVTSTHIKYEPPTLHGTITQHYGSKMVAPLEKRVIVPEYWDTKAVDALKEKEGLTYLQAYFDTLDDGDKILQAMEELSGKKRSEIKLWTPKLVDATYTIRSQLVERAAVLNYSDSGFHLYGNLDPDLNGGRSRRV
ncbi:MAG: hypothetical protein WC471_01180 [Candidatus Woesearchaeota archaeon]